MIIGQAIPEVFSRTYATLQPGTPVLVALSLLRFQKVDAIPIILGGTSSVKVAISGQSSLSEVFANSPSNFAELLEKPCESFSIKLATITVEDDLEKLLRIISRTGFGFACVEEKVGREICGLVSLRDLLALYNKSIFNSELSLGDIASFPVFSLPGNVTLKSTLGEMLRQGIRRVFISGTEKVVSDRSIINHIFSAAKLNETSNKPYDLLETEIGKIEGSNPTKIDSEANVKEGAELMMQTTDGCLVCEKGVVTPWDLVIKPWKQGKLAIQKQNM